MADILVGDTVRLHGNVVGTVLSKTDTGAQHFVVIEYELAEGKETTTRQIKDLTETSANNFYQTGMTM